MNIPSQQGFTISVLDNNSNSGGGALVVSEGEKVGSRVHKLLLLKPPFAAKARYLVV